MPSHPTFPLLCTVLRDQVGGPRHLKGHNSKIPDCFVLEQITVGVHCPLRASPLLPFATTIQALWVGSTSPSALLAATRSRSTRSLGRCSLWSVACLSPCSWAVWIQSGVVFRYRILRWHVRSPPASLK